MKVRIQDIAEAAHVSQATVSNVLNGTNRVAEETRLRVLELAKEMGYRSPAQTEYKKSIQLAIFRKHGHIITDSQFFSELFLGIETACRKNDYELILTNISADDKELVSEIASSGTRPLLLVATEMLRDDMLPFVNFPAPLVVLDSHFYDCGFNSVCIDNVKAGYLAGKCLIEAGHTEFGMITSSDFFNNMRERQIGFETALWEHGYSLKLENVFPVEPTGDGAMADFKKLLENRTSPLPTGIFAFNDIVGVAAMRAMKSKGLKIPNDISLIGMDNINLSTLINPPLTTINVPRYELGYIAAQRLIALAQEPDLPRCNIAVDTSLVLRGSVQNLR